MRDQGPAPNAWRPMHPPNMGPSSNAGLHMTRPPLLPRSGDMDIALSMNAVSTDLMILQNFTQNHIFRIFSNF